MNPTPIEPWDHQVLLTRQLRQFLVRLRFLGTMDDEQAARHALLPDELASLMSPEERQQAAMRYVRQMVNHLDPDPAGGDGIQHGMTRWRQALERVRARLDWAQFPPTVRRRALSRADYLLAKAAEGGFAQRDHREHVWRLTAVGLDTLQRG